MASLDLNDPVIRERMLSPEFLDGARSPHVRWAVTKFDGDARRAISAVGELSIRPAGTSRSRRWSSSSSRCSR